MCQFRNWHITILNQIAQTVECASLYWHIKILNQIPQTVECKVQSKKVECKVECQRPATVWEYYLDKR